MRLDKIITRIKENIATRQRGVRADQVMVDRRELQELMRHFDSMDRQLFHIHIQKSVAMGLANAELANMIEPESEQPNLHDMIIEQNPERRTDQRKPVTSFDWELQQALIHLQNAISVTSAHRAHLLQTALQIAKGVRESD